MTQNLGTPQGPGIGLLGLDFYSLLYGLGYE